MLVISKNSIYHTKASLYVWIQFNQFSNQHKLTVWEFHLIIHLVGYKKNKLYILAESFIFYMRTNILRVSNSYLEVLQLR